MNETPETPLSPASEADYRSTFVSAPDGLRLHVREYGARISSALPVVCLPGLARTAGDFHALAKALAADPAAPRRVVALDYRGRGESDHDPNAENYSLPVELADLRAVLTALGISPAVFIGTSRGGLLTMLLAAAQPAAIAGAILNDIGPVIEPQGLLRIKGYVGKLPQPRTIDEGAQILKRLFDAQFPNLTNADWEDAARLTWVERNGQLRLSYDPQLSRTLATFDLDQPVPALWPQFDALGTIPLMVIRGGLSDLLSAKTVAAMRTRRKDMEIVEVADQGHPPLLGSPDMIRRIAGFSSGCDASATQH
jgi:pimeloyl-ACP methyl ester carboxylesterase